MTEPSDALRKQLGTDAGPHPTPDQERAAAKRRTAAGVESRTQAPAQRRAPTKSTG
jgi:hypothetical protein